MSEELADLRLGHVKGQIADEDRTTIQVVFVEKFFMGVAARGIPLGVKGVDAVVAMAAQGLCEGKLAGH